MAFVPFNQTGWIPSKLERVGLGDDLTRGIYTTGLRTMGIGTKPVTDDFGVRKFFEDLMADDRLSHHETFVFFVLVKLSAYWEAVVFSKTDPVPCSGAQFWNKHKMAAQNVISELLDVAKGAPPRQGVFSGAWHAVVKPADKPEMDEVTQQRLRTNLNTFVQKANLLLCNKVDVPECSASYLGTMVERFYTDGGPKFTDRQQRALLKLAVMVSVGPDVQGFPPTCRVDFTCFLAWLYDKFYKPASEPRPRLYINQQSNFLHIQAVVYYLKEIESGLSAPDFWSRVASQVDCIHLRADMEGDDWLVVLLLHFMRGRCGTQIRIDPCYHPDLIAAGGKSLATATAFLGAAPIPEPLAGWKKEQQMLDMVDQLVVLAEAAEKAGRSQLALVSVPGPSC